MEPCLFRGLVTPVRPDNLTRDDEHWREAGRLQHEKERAERARLRSRWLQEIKDRVMRQLGG